MYWMRACTGQKALDVACRLALTKPASWRAGILYRPAA
jgi:hypothetical protein